MGVDELQGCHIPEGTVRPLFIVLSSPGFNHALRFLQRQQPVLVQTFIPKRPVEALDKGVLHRLSRLHEGQVRAKAGPLSRIKVSGSGRVRNRRSRIRHIRAPPIDTSTSITGTSFEHGSVIVKHVNRRPVTSRSCTKSIT